MIRAALYARYSSDLQSAASIEDQFRICRDHAERAGWTIVDTYRDAAISGDSMILRPGIQALLADARSGAFDVVVAEALDRMSRDQADVSALFKHLQFARVMIVTLAEGEVNELHVGLKGTMNALFLKDLAAKTHRGLRGRVEKGRSGGGLCYGYDVVTTFDAAGEPVRGERTINEAEANVVRRVFRDFASGVSPRTIARRLNAEGVAGPSGKLWTDSTIRGQVKRGTGLINNELYIGRLVWNRLRYVKNPETGKRVSRINPREEWIVTEVLELRIVDDELWQAVKQRQEELTAQYATVIEATRTARANRLNGTHRPRHLLSGLLECGACGGPYAMRGQDRYGCSNHVMNGSCSNSRGIRRTELEERVLVGLRDHLMAPEAADAAVRAWAEETNRLNRERCTSSEAERRELADVEKNIEGIVDAIQDGAYSAVLKERLHKLEARKAELTKRLATVPAEIPDIHPNVAGVYRRKVARLAKAESIRWRRRTIGHDFAGAGSGSVLEAPALVAGLDDLAVVGETIEQRRGHLWVAEDGGPLAEGEVGCDDDRGAFVEPAHEVAEHLPRFIDSYNERRLHSALAYLGPNRFEENHSRTPVKSAA